jgi:hypothetical protein
VQVLVVGYGKIGRIKAFMWQSLGAEVFVFDANPRIRNKITRDSFTLYRRGATPFKGLVDISTPAGTHFDALNWCISQSNFTAERVLIEKPLASSEEELNSFVDLLKNNPSIRERISINESYYQSSALEYVYKEIRANNSDVLELTVELSKNRLNDHDTGRFFDASLDAIGIEVPHMLAIIDFLGVGLNSLANTRPKLIIDSARPDNQAVALDYQSASQRVRLTSCLGDFRMTEMARQDNLPITRSLEIKTTECIYIVEFDPAPDCPRYHSKVATYKNNELIDEKILVDDHLKKHMQLFMNNSDYLDYRSFIGVDKAILHSPRHLYA